MAVGFLIDIDENIQKIVQKTSKNFDPFFSIVKFEYLDQI